jgi:RHS repeat-associated protein
MIPRAGESINYHYDALGRRVVRQDKKTGRTEFTHDDLDVLQDRKLYGDTTTTTNYVNGLGVDDKLKVTSGSTSKYFLTDHLGSTVGLADTNGNITESATYDSFGNKLSSNLSTRYQYTGRESDETTGLMYYRARFYDPQIGRFISEDPIGFAGGINLYAYVKSNPVLYRDPTGLQRCNPIVGAIVGGVLGAGAGAVVGAGIGAIGGCIIGAASVGTAGTLVAPGVGTVGGGTIGCAAGAAIGAVGGAFVGSAIGAAAGGIIGYNYCSGGEATTCDSTPKAVPIPFPTPNTIPLVPPVPPLARPTPCPPCPPPPPPQIHRVPPARPHYPCPGDHWHYFVYNQNPVTCQCFLQRRFGGCCGTPGAPC